MKKFQMLFEHNVVSNVTSNQEPLHEIQIKYYFYVQFSLIGAFLGKNIRKMINFVRKKFSFGSCQFF